MQATREHRKRQEVLGRDNVFVFVFVFVFASVCPSARPFNTIACFLSLTVAGHERAVGGMRRWTTSTSRISSARSVLTDCASSAFSWSCCRRFSSALRHHFGTCRGEQCACVRACVLSVCVCVCVCVCAWVGGCVLRVFVLSVCGCGFCLCVCVYVRGCVGVEVCVMGQGSHLMALCFSLPIASFILHGTHAVVPVSTG